MRSLFSCRPVRDDTIVTAYFNRRTTYKKCFFLSRRDNIRG